MNAMLMSAGRVLILRAGKPDYENFSNAHLAFGLLCTWLVGMGRHWDNPRIELLQQLGVGSVVYVFILAIVLWLPGIPFRDSSWSYKRVLTVVVLSAPPAALYAIPVERWLEFEAARSVNVWFLAIVAAWRMAIWYRFLRAMLPVGITLHLSVFLLPVVAIITTLAVLNLDRVVADFMSGLQNPPEGTVNDEAYVWLQMISILSMFFVFPVVLVIYAVAWVRRFLSRSQLKNA